ncbi:uncharacterized protein CEXT_633291 [Caerostris extrusa]|uniref:Uncharacterized protein n=1 Tax=Caerostris extrusa TaxID=172846 RepID=A0AAV4MX95_CAEEX|nr:uncharacterized protein CEXT_633291 [Caerostris extrusa]
MILSGEAELALSFLSVNEQRSKAVNFSTGYTIEENIFYKLMPQVRKSAFAFLYPFNVNLWICLMGAIITLSIVLAKFEGRTTSILGTLFKIFANILGQPLIFKNNSLKSNTLLSFWLFFANKFSYSATLLSFLIQPLRESPIQNFYELSKAVQAGSHKDYFSVYSIHRLSNSNLAHLRQLGEFLARNNEIEDLKGMTEQNYLTHEVVRSLSRDNAKIFFGNRNGIYYSENTLFVNPTAFAFGKNFLMYIEIEFCYF